LTENKISIWKKEESWVKYAKMKQTHFKQDVFSFKILAFQTIYKVFFEDNFATMNITNSHDTNLCKFKSFTGAVGSSGGLMFSYVPDCTELSLIITAVLIWVKETSTVYLVPQRPHTTRHVKEILKTNVDKRRSEKLDQPLFARRNSDNHLKSESKHQKPKRTSYSGLESKSKTSNRNRENYSDMESKSKPSNRSKYSMDIQTPLSQPTSNSSLPTSNKKNKSKKANDSPDLGNESITLSSQKPKKIRNSTLGLPSTNNLSDCTSEVKPKKNRRRNSDTVIKRNPERKKSPPVRRKYRGSVGVLPSKPITNSVEVLSLEPVTNSGEVLSPEPVTKIIIQSTKKKTIRTSKNSPVVNLKVNEIKKKTRTPNPNRKSTIDQSIRNSSNPIEKTET